MEWTGAQMEIDARAAAVIAAGMRAVALADGEMHEAELALITAFEAELPEGVDPAGVRLEAGPLQEVFLHSIVMVALADGCVSDAEYAAIVELGQSQGVSTELIDERVREAKRTFLKTFAGARAFHDEAVGIGEQLGLSHDEAEEVIGS